MIGVDILGAPQLVVRFQAFPAALRARILQTVVDLNVQLMQRVQANLSGVVLTPGKPPRLLNSIQSRVTPTSASVTGTVTAGNYRGAVLPYARILEYGGLIHTPEIVPVKGQALAFISPGKMPIGKSGASGLIFARRTRAHDTNIPEFAYMRRSLAQMRAQIIAELKAATLTEVSQIAAE